MGSLHAKEIFMKSTTALLLLGAALCMAGPASAGDSHWRSRVVVVPPGGFTTAPISHKVFDRRWPYVSWIGVRDSLYAPGPLVTFVRYDSY